MSLQLITPLLGSPLSESAEAAVKSTYEKWKIAQQCGAEERGPAKEY